MTEASDPIALIVDESHRSSSEIAEILADAGCPVSGATSCGLRAVELYRQKVPDVVFVSLGLGGAGGIACIRALRAFDPGAVVVAVATWSTSHLMMHAVDAGVRHLVLKPLHGDRVRTALRELEVISATAPVGASMATS